MSYAYGPMGTYPRLKADWLKHETDPQIYRENIVVKAGAGQIITGTVLGRITVGAATAAAKAGGNTGNGVLTMDATTPVLADAVAGVYRVRCITAAANGGTFEIENPAGAIIGRVAVAGTWSEGIKFAIADGANDFVVGDGFDITVAAGSDKWVPCNLAALDGSRVPAGILLDYVDASGEADVKGVVVTGGAEVVLPYLTFDTSFTGADAAATLANKKAAMTTLARIGIKQRALA